MARNAYIETRNNDPINTLAEAKIHLRVDFTDDNDYIESLCIAAKETIENYCNVILLRTTVVQYCDTWDDSKVLYFSPSLNSGDIAVSSIVYIDPDNVNQTWSTANYIVDGFSAPAGVSLAVGKSYPTTIGNKTGAISVTYVVGASLASSIPEQIKQASLILIGNMYENRQEIIVGRSVGSIPMTARYLMNPYKIQTLGQC